MALSAASQKILAVYNNYKTNQQKQTTQQKLNPPQVKPKTAILHPSVIAAQQALSEKYGIATFDLQGKVNTIPITRPFSGINFGTGSSGLTSQGLIDYLKKIVPQTATVPTMPIILRDNKTIIDTPKDSKLVEGETPINQREISPTISTTIQQYTPYLILGGIALLAITLLKR